MAAPTIPNGEEHFFPIIYEGNGAGQKVGKFVPFTDNFTVANSCMFDDGDSPSLARTPSSGGDRRTWTFSAWIKRGNLTGAEQYIFSASNSASSTKYDFIYWDTDNCIRIQHHNGSSVEGQLKTNRTFEDTSKFYHLFYVFDSTNTTAGNRMRLYIDGDEITSFSIDTNPSLNYETDVNDTTPQTLGKPGWASAVYFDGYMAEVNLVDGQALAPADFGITDTSTGRWIPVAYPTTLTTFTVTVSNPGSGNKYFIDGSQAATVTLQEGGVYRFDQSDSSNSTHPLRFSTTSDGSHGGGSEYTTGVTTNGTPGSTGAYTQITVASGAATLYYYCTAHSGMGGTANTPDPFSTNGFKLKFQQSNALGDDTSGKGNDFTSSGLTTTDQTTDSPTQNHNTFGSFASGTSASEGNLTISTGTTNGDTQCVAQAGFGVATGKWYWEAKITTVGAGLYGWKDDANAGGSQAVNTSSNGTHSTNNSAGMLSTGSSGSFSSGSWFIDGGYGDEVNYTTVSTNDVLMFAIDLDTGKGYCGKNGTWFNSANPANGTGDIGGCHFANGINKFYPMARRLDSNSVAEYNFGQRSFAHTPPTGFSALQQDNLPETSKGVSGLVWIKDRDATKNHNLFDSSRGKHKELRSNSTDEEFTNADTLQKFLKGGFSIEDGTSVNNSGDSFVAWNWVANSGTTASNGNGSVTSAVQANTTAGFSIIEATAAASGNFTVGHGLSSPPEFFWLKMTGTAGNWVTYHHSFSTVNGEYILLDSTTAAGTSANAWGSAIPTSSVIGLGAASSVTASQPFVIHAWHGVDGFSKFGKYEGNNNADGAFVYTGFRPALVIIKSIDGGSSSYPWAMYDSKRSPINPVSLFLSANDTVVDNTLDRIDFLSNGFKCRQGYSYSNAGETYIYMAWAEHPFVGDGTNPVTAR